MNAMDYAVIAVVAVLFVLCARYAFRHRNHSCGGGMDCSHCPYHGSCSEKKRK